jgi:hypothetical protein
MEEPGVCSRRAAGFWQAALASLLEVTTLRQRHPERVSLPESFLGYFTQPLWQRRVGPGADL